MLRSAAVGHGVFRAVGFLLMAFIVLSLAACGGTKVYTVDKSLVYRGNIYNLSNVRVVSSKMEATLADGEIINLKGADKKRVNALLDEHSTLNMKTVVVMDQQEMIYEARQVNKYSDFSKMDKNLNSAMGKIQKFIGDKKKRQLELK